jgi:adenylosuccinate lyase
MSETTGDAISRSLDTLEIGTIPDILADRYATEPMKRIFSPASSVVIERHILIAIMEAQADMGVDIPAEHIDDYRAVIDQIDFASMLERERVSKHDVNSRVAEFNALAGHQYAMQGMTSRDLTENAEQLQKRLALELIRIKVAAGVGGLAHAAAANTFIPITGRTHIVPAQMTTLGKRFSTSGEELIDGYNSLSFHLDNLKLRGVKGAVGTQQDMLDLLGDEEEVDELDERLAQMLGFSGLYNTVGQIYPRSQDLETIQALGHVVAPLSNFATGIRHMMGHGLLTETKKKRVGSNAMPHKINPRTAERIVGFHSVLGGFEAMVRPKAGEQWLEGDVSDSVIRRVALAPSFYAADGALESALTVINGFGLFEPAIKAEVEANMPFLATTKILTACIKKGMGREDAHEAIRDHAFETVKQMKEHGQAANDLLDRIANDPNIPMDRDEIMQAIETPMDLTGRAVTQVRRFVEQAEQVVAKHPEAAAYLPKDIL